MEISRLLCVSLLVGLAASQCRLMRKCGECIRAGCKWCADPALEEKFAYRCFAPNEDPLGCGESHVYPKEATDRFEVLRNDSFSISVLFRPQKVKLKLTVGEEYDLQIKYKHARNYPVDLYYLMDLSASMREHKRSLSRLGQQLATEMQRITPDFRLGFGSFVDKVTMPYVNTVPAKLRSPCSDGGCVTPYGFKNHLKLDNDSVLFETRVDKAKVSANIDTPEGGFDAIMQAIVCPQHIGWRKEARHLLILSTDAEYHFAGDGRLAGLVEPNDMQCYVSGDQVYHRTTDFDYPSISQINKVAQENNVNLIFAVTGKVHDTYKRLAERIHGASHGMLDTKSSNVVDLIRNEYRKIADSLTLTSTADPEFIHLELQSNCKGRWQNSPTCKDLYQGNEVQYNARIKVVKCPPGGRVKFQLKPTALEVNVDVEMTVSCDCECEQQDRKNKVATAGKCSNNGYLQCGICECDPDHYGDFCQCMANMNNLDQDNATLACRQRKEDPICSDVGVCKCGVCVCNERDNPFERYSGHYCECNNFECRRSAGVICSGPDHGTCECGVCKCASGWSGEACECALNKQTCFQPGTNLECSGKGSCVCGTCKCGQFDGVQYSGKYCQDCPTCKSKQCAAYSDLVDCTIFQSGPLKDECPEANFTMVKVDFVEVPEQESDTVRVCRIPDEDGCYFSFSYVVDSDVVTVQRTKECIKQVNILALVLGLVGGIVLIGLLFLIIWKIVTTIHDNREYIKFKTESESAMFDRGANPLYVPSTTTFENPTFKEK